MYVLSLGLYNCQEDHANSLYAPFEPYNVVRRTYSYKCWHSIYTPGGLVPLGVGGAGNTSAPTNKSK